MSCRCEVVSLEKSPSSSRIEYAIRVGVKSFADKNRRVILPPDIVQVLNSFVDREELAKRIMMGGAIEEVSEATVSFLSRASQRQEALEKTEGFEGFLHSITRPPLRIGANDLQKAREAFWCTIYPFCRPK